MESPKVSIVVPAYNTGKYIYRAIESSIGQDYDNVELIVIDDGSDDDTLAVANKYLEKESKMKVISQRNEGVSSARNLGIANASGEWLIFLDSDDWIEKNAVSELLRSTLRYENKLSCCDCYFVSENNGFLQREKQNSSDEPITMSSHDYLMNMRTGKYRSHSACYKLFNKKVIIENKLSFCRDFQYGEDGLFVFEYLNFVDGVHYEPLPLWNILEREGSATASLYSPKWMTALYAVNQMLNESKWNLILYHSLAAYSVEVSMHIAISGLSSGIEKEEMLIIKRQLKEQGKHFFSYSPVKDRLKYIFLRYIPFTFQESLFNCYRIVKRAETRKEH